ncbi:MAG: hypothetical protein ABI467_16580 [Kofleriaceae bacterium]
MVPVGVESLVIRRHVLAALATGVEAGDDDAARAALAGIDWVLRGPARRRLERALLDAAIVSRALVNAADPEAMRHLQRVAALSIAGHDDVDATQRDAVTDAYVKLPPPHPPAPVATLLAGLAVLAAVGLLGLAVIAIRTPASHRRVRDQVPLPWGAFLTGGTPRTDPGLDRLLTDDLASFVIEVDSGRHGELELRDAPAIVAQGPGLARAWRELIDALDALGALGASADHLGHTRDYAAAKERLRAAAQRTSDQFAALGLGYHLEADVLGDRGPRPRAPPVAHGTVFAFRVEEVVYVHAGGAPRRVLSLRRLDHLDVAHAVLGMQTEELGDPVVLLDQVDAFVASHLAPVVFGGEFPVGDDAFARTATGRALELASGGAIARELAPLHRDRARITQLVVATVRRHEARHGFDNDRPSQLRYPAALAAYVGDSTRSTAAFVARARAELAAYTSQIASDPRTPQLALWNLANLAFRRDHWSAAESYVAVVVVEGLARELGVKPANGPVIHDGQLDRQRLAGLALPLAHMSDDDLRAAARRLWQDFYDEGFIAIVDPAPIVATLGP